MNAVNVILIVPVLLGTSLAASHNPLCPPPSGLASTCDFNRARGDCITHADCFNGKICCPEGCGKRCVNPNGPITIRPSPSIISVCPPPIDRHGICRVGLNYCSDDSPCPKGQMCCKDECGQTCQNPVIKHKGSCPYYGYRRPVYCAKKITSDECFQDSHCAIDEKCCRVGCSKRCRKAILIGQLWSQV